jgi:diguanylate cyclase (GGDEF)-like protein
MLDMENISNLENMIGRFDYSLDDAIADIADVDAHKRRLILDEASSSYLARGDIDSVKTLYAAASIAGAEANDMYNKVGSKNVELEKMAHEDVLTGLENRRSFDKALEREIALTRRNGGNLSLVFFDIDHFKPFNDNYGHDAGDYVLNKIGKVISDNVRVSDIASRYGGEEFTVILPDTDKKAGYIAAEKIRKAIEGEEWVYNGKDLGKVTVSLGVSGYDSSLDAGSFVKQADDAAYEAKAGGRNQVALYKD